MHHDRVVRCRDVPIHENREKIGSLSKPVSLYSRLPNAVASLLFAAAIVLVAFPEVVFLNGNLAPTGMHRDANRAAPRPTVQAYPSLQHGVPQLGIRDVGARVWQVEPATKFMRRAIWDGESPYWNPYSAAGSLGVETIVDIKLAPIVVVSAFFGASSTAFSFVLLAFLIVSLYCMQQFFTRSLDAGRLAATAACIVFLLNGFASSDVNSQIGAPYVLFPVVLYTLAERVRTGGFARLLLAVAAHALLILTTFWTVGVLMLVLAHAVVLVLGVSHWHREPQQPLVRRTIDAAARQAIVPLVALLVTAYFWLPILDGLRLGAGDLGRYSESRRIGSKDPLELLTFLTPSHLYYAADANSYGRYINAYGVWTIYLGIVPLLLVAAALPRARGIDRRLLLVSCGLGIYGLTQHAGVPVVKEIAGLPGFRAVGQDYWATWSAAGLALAVGVGVASIRRRGVGVRTVQVTGGLFAAAFVVALYNTRDVSLTRTAIVSISAAILLIAIVIALVMFVARHPNRRRVIVMIAVALMGVELLAYQPHVRMRRSELYDSMPKFVTFLRENLGDDRILNAGRGGVYGEWGTVLRIPQVETLTTTQLPHYRSFFLGFINPFDPWHFIQTGRLVRQQFAVDPYALDLLSVRYLVVDQAMENYDAGVRAQYPLVFDDPVARVKVYENPDPFPRAYLSPALAPEPPEPELTPDEELQHIVRLVRGVPPSPPTFTMGTTYTDDPQMLAAARRANIGPNGSDAPAPGDARITRYENDEVRIEVDANEPAMLVLTDSYHTHWKATIDGEAADVGRVNRIARGMIVPRGRSTVVFHYQSRPRDIGALISLTTLAVLLVLSVMHAWRRRRPTRPRVAQTGAQTM
jgi:hypothetical protein